MQNSISQNDDILPIFNHFFDNLPKHRSYDMAFRVYLRDLADVEDRSALLSTKSLTDLTQIQPTCIAAYGRITPTTKPAFSLTKKNSSTSLMSTVSTNKSTNVLLKKQSETAEKKKPVASPEENKKPRSLMSLYDANQMILQRKQQPEQKTCTSSTTYSSQSNITKPSSTSSSLSCSLTEKKTKPLKFVKKPRSMVNLYEANQLPMPSKRLSKITTPEASTSSTHYENLNMQVPPTLISTISATSTTDMTESSNINFSKNGWILISSKKQKYSNDVKIDVSDLFE